jgi:branched-chain amino acid aminotransferase
MNVGSLKAYYNGNYVPNAEARFSIYDSGIIWGDIVFELTRSFNHIQFRLREHLERMFNSIRMVRIPLKITPDEMEQIILKTVEINESLFDADEEIRVMVNISRGPLDIYRDLFDGPLTPTVIVDVYPLSPSVSKLAGLFDTGVHVVTPNQRAIPPHLMDPKVKSRSRLYYQLANLEVAASNPAAWPLLLEPDGCLAEGTGSNFFLVKSGAMYTSEPRSVLRGVSRQYVMELAAKLSIPNFERNLSLYDVINADEAFFTSTPFCLMPATYINGLPIGAGKPGPVGRQLLAAWSQAVGVDIVGQIQRFADRLKQ